MTTKTKRIYFFTVIGILSIGAAAVLYQYNKGPLNIKNESGVPVEAAILYHAFLKDSLQAGHTYSIKIVESTGLVAQVSKNQQNQTVILLMTNETGAFINCTMEGETDLVKEDEKVIIKGICSGIGLGDSDLGITGDVYLSRCYLSK